MRRGTGKPWERRRRDRIRVMRLIKRMSEEGRDAEPGETKRMRKRGGEPWVREMPARQGQAHFLIDRQGAGTCLRFNDHIIPVAHLPPPHMKRRRGAAGEGGRRGATREVRVEGSGRE